MNNNQSINSFIKELSKVELHIHLEGTISPATFLRLAQKNKTELASARENDIRKLLTIKDFPQFLNNFMVLTQTIRTAEDFSDITYELGRQLNDQHIIYAEVMISIAQYHFRGLPLDEILHGAASGAARVKREWNITINFALDYGRQYGIPLGEKLLDVAIRNKKYGVVAWSMGGDEASYPSDHYTDLYKKARDAGLYVMAHAGEAAGPESVWGAVDNLKCQRIGHGIRSVEDQKLLTHLRDRSITLDICPTSNLRTGVIKNIKDHPIIKIFYAVITLTLNTDDPVFFKTTLINEYQLLIDTFKFSIDETIVLVKNAAESAFLNTTEKMKLKSSIDIELKNLRKKYAV